MTGLGLTVRRSSGHGRAVPGAIEAQASMQSDEVFARMIQAEELAAASLAVAAAAAPLTQAQPARHSSRHTARKEASRADEAAGQLARCSDADLAARLQAEEDEAARSEAATAGNGVRAAANGATNSLGHSGAASRVKPRLSDEEFARMLQQEEDDAERSPLSAQASRSAAFEDRQRRRWDGLPDADAVLQSIGQCCGGGFGGRWGALIGCFTGLQLGDCIGCGHAVAWLCALAGAGLGATASRAPRPRSFGGRGYRDTDSDWFPEDSDEDAGLRRGVDNDTIEAHSVGTVYEACPPGNAGAAPSAASAAGDENRSCMICMEVFATGDLLRTLPCLHRYHRTCCDEWLRRCSECPICKRDITELSLPPSATGPTGGHAVRPRMGLRSLLGIRRRSRVVSR